METVQDSGGLRVDGSKGSVVASGLSSSKTVNQLRIVESGDESGKMVIPTKSEMDPYKELELYLAKVNVSLFTKKFLRYNFYLVSLDKRDSYERDLSFVINREIYAGWFYAKTTDSLLYLDSLSRTVSLFDSL